jgi:hypothetical protein
MKNRKAVSALAALAILALGSTTAFAHDGIEHIMGTLSAKTSTTVTVETVKHTKVTVLLDPATTFSWNDKSASLNDLKVGERIIANAKEDANEKLHCVSIRWGANSTSDNDHKK